MNKIKHNQTGLVKFIFKSHLIIGTIFIGLFLLTGGYMNLNFPELYGGREEVRMMFRSTHIYILMSALINLMAGNYLTASLNTSFLPLKKLASLLILASPILFFFGFIYEPPEYLIERPFSYWGVISLFVGVLLHTILNIKWLKKNSI
jgi:hypothetical protein